MLSRIQNLSLLVNTCDNTRNNEYNNNYIFLYQVLEQVTPKPDHVRRDIAIQFSQKNRSMDYPPREYKFKR